MKIKGFLVKHLLTKYYFGESKDLAILFKYKIT